jgi:hydrogenase expression/formation protein HypD
MFVVGRSSFIFMSYDINYQEDDRVEKWLESFRDSGLAGRIVEGLQGISLPRPVRFMEVCGTHTVSICRHGIGDLLPPEIVLTAGPGCPVCVTSTAEIDVFIKAAMLPDVIITSYGDMLRVPGSRGSLQDARAEGADIRTVYSSMDALAIAGKNPDRQVIFLGIGFETTTPTVAAAVLQAAEQGIGNFSVISTHKVMPPALDALLSDPAIAIDGLICPGHVSIMIGARAYRPYVETYSIPCVISGFEPVDILEAIVMLSRQVSRGVADVEISYKRAVQEQGNVQAMRIMDMVFEPADSYWRGLGMIPASGLMLRPQYESFDAYKRFSLAIEEAREPAGCACGDVLKSIIMPTECKLFGKVCTPEHPVGPCMVSMEGSCGAFYRYRKE